MYPTCLLATIVVFCSLNVTTANASSRILQAEFKSISDSTLPDVLKKAELNTAGDMLMVTFTINGTGTVLFTLTKMGSKETDYVKEVSFNETGSQSYMIDMRSFPKGNYVLDFRSRQRFSAKKLIVKN